MARIFLSYTSDDKTRVREVYHRLQSFSGSLMRDQLHSSEVGFQIRLPTSGQHFVKKDLAAYTGFPLHCYSKAVDWYQRQQALSMK